MGPTEFGPHPHPSLGLCAGQDDKTGELVEELSLLEIKLFFPQDDSRTIHFGTGVEKRA